MKQPRAHSGFTILEMLLALAVLGVVVLGSFSLSGLNNRGKRFDDSHYRLKHIREAIVGSLESQVEESQLISGFVADIGRLPDNISELINQGTLPSWTYDEPSNQWSGWRGPYLHSFTVQSGVSAFPDGWGNFGDTNNFGWNFEVDQEVGTLFVQTYGADGGAGGTGYDLDYPIDQLLIHPREALLDIADWEITVYLHNPEDIGGGGPPLPSENLTLRVRLYYPQEGALDWPETWPSSATERDEATYLSDAIAVPTGSVTDGTALTLLFSFGEDSKLIPYGVRTLGIVNDQDGIVIGDISQDKWRVNLLSRMKLRPEALAWNLE